MSFNINPGKALSKWQFIACVYGGMALLCALAAGVFQWGGGQLMGLPSATASDIAFGFAVLAAANVAALFAIEALTVWLRRYENN